MVGVGWCGVAGWALLLLEWRHSRTGGWWQLVVTRTPDGENN